MASKNSLDNVSDSLTNTIKDAELEKISIDVAEALLDSELSEGLLKNIPILGTLFSLFKISNNIKDKLFVKKLIHFLENIKDIDKTQRKKIINKIDSSNKYKIKVGEKLLYILDKAEDYEKTSIIGIFFKAFLQEKINYAQFLKICQIIDRVTKDEINSFLKGNYFNEDFDLPFPISIEKVSSYVNVGLFEIAPFKIKLKKESGRAWGIDESVGYELKDTAIKAQITQIGIVIFKILNRN